MKDQYLCALLTLALGNCELAQLAKSLLLLKYQIKITKNDPPTKTGRVYKVLH